MHIDSLEHFDDFRCRKSRQNDDFKGRFYTVAEFASLGAENRYCLTIFGAENRTKMTILGANFMKWPIWCCHIVPRNIVLGTLFKGDLVPRRVLISLDAYCPNVVVRVTPSHARARESFMSILNKLSWAQMLMRASWAYSWRLHEHYAGVQWAQYGWRW